MYWLGIDVGTGGTRALLVDKIGNVRASFTAPHEAIRMERVSWAEQHPDNWWEAAAASVRGVLAAAGVSGEAVNGIGLSGQMHGLVMLDADNKVIRPALIWCDQRSQAQVDWINRKAGRKRILDATRNPMLTGFTLPKLMWVRDNEPAQYDRARHILLPKDYIRFQLTGEYATDVADGSGTGLLNVLERRWSHELAGRLGVSREILPSVCESTEVTGRVTARAAEITGLREGTPVAAGAGDQAASAIGCGIVAPGVSSCTMGTSGVVFVHMDEPKFDPKGRVHTFCHAVPGKWHMMGVTQGAGLSLQWFRNQLGGGADYDALTAEAATAPPGAQGLFWLPYLMGERTPHLDSQARGGWIGLTARHTRADLIRAVIEGVCFSMKDCLDLIEQSGIAVESVRMVGGGSRSPFWRQTLADVLDKRVVTLASDEGSAYGAALLSMVATGEFATPREACAAVVRETGSVLPRPSRYAEAHAVYKSLYPALKKVYRATEAEAAAV